MYGTAVQINLALLPIILIIGISVKKRYSLEMNLLEKQEQGIKVCEENNRCWFWWNNKEKYRAYQN